MLSLRRWAVLLFLLLAGCAGKQPAEPIQIAHLLPLTGPDKKAAEDAQHGMLLAVEEINADDQRINGRTVVVRTIDCRGDADQMQAEAVRLVTLNKVSAFVAGPDSQGVEKLVRATQAYSVPVVVPGNFPPGTGLDGFVSMEATPAFRGIVLARYTVKELKPKQVIVLTDQQDSITVALAAAFVQEWPRSESMKLEEWPFRNETEQIDFASHLAEMGAGVVALFAGKPAEFLTLQGKLRDKKATVTLLYGGEDLGTGAFQKNGVEMYMTTVFVPETLTDKGKGFAKRYEEHFHEPPPFAAAQAYDAGRLLFETMQQAKTGNAGRVREDLMKLESFDSLTGKIVWKDHQPRRPLFVVRVKDGEAKVVDTIAPEEK